METRREKMVDVKRWEKGGRFKKNSAQEQLVDEKYDRLKLTDRRRKNRGGGYTRKVQRSIGVVINEKAWGGVDRWIAQF
ncbi:hypothetical protein LINPERPRIM_LOCUS9244 [Linum perenne]